MSDQKTPDILEMSDEDFLKMDLPEDSPAPEADEEEQRQDDEAAKEEEDQQDEQEAESDEADNEDGDADSDDEQDAADDDAGADDSEKAADDDGKDADDKDDTKEGKDDNDTKEGDISAADAKAAVEFRKAILAPFKANGRTMQVKSPEEALQLMQMGANYNKKMAGLKPGLRVLKMLENNQLMDETKLSYLIDLDKKNPMAVRKLLKESGLDPLELSDDKDATEYTPSSHSVDDRELELDSVFESIKGSEHYQQTLDVANNWDQASKRVLFDNPQTLKLLNEHMSNGIFDMVMDEVNSQRVLGKLNGYSDIQAYHAVGQQLAQAGKFGQPAKKDTDPAQDPSPAPAKAKPAAKQPDPKVKEKKRAASSTRSKPPKSKPADFNPLNMSDDEFEKAMNADLL